MVDLSVVIVANNDSGFIVPCLRTLFSSSFRGVLEAFVIDNNSSDDTAERVRREFPQVHLTVNESKQGFSFNNNQGLRKAHGRYLLLLNPDTEVEANTLQEMVDFMEDHPEAGAVGCKLYNKRGVMETSCRAFPTLMTVFWEMSLLDRIFSKNSIIGKRLMLYKSHDQIQEVDWLCGAFILTRKEVLEKVGYLDEGFFLFLEDVDWCFRVKKAGWKVYYNPQGKALHHKSGSTKGWSQWSYVEHYKSLYRFFKKHYGLRNAVLLKPLILMGMMIRMGAIPFLWLYKGREEALFRLKAYAKVMKLSLLSSGIWGELVPPSGGLGAEPPSEDLNRV